MKDERFGIRRPINGEQALQCWRFDHELIATQHARDAVAAHDAEFERCQGEFGFELFAITSSGGGFAVNDGFGVKAKVT